MPPKNLGHVALVAIAVASCTGPANNSSSTYTTETTTARAPVTANTIAMNLPSIDSAALCSSALSKGEQQQIGARSAKPQPTKDVASCYYLMSDDGKAGYIVSIFNSVDSLTQGVDTTIWPQKPEPLILEGLPAVRQAAYSGDKWQSEIVVATNTGKFLSVTHYTLPNSVTAQDLNEKASNAAKAVLRNLGTS